MAHMSTGFGRMYQRGRGWWIAYPWPGHGEQRESVARLLHMPARLTTEADARHCLRERHKQIVGGRFAGTGEEKVTVSDLLAAYLQWLELAGRKSLPQIRCHLKAIDDALGAELALGLRTARLTDWIAQQEAAGAARDTTITRLSYLRSAYRHRQESSEPLSRLPVFPRLGGKRVRRDMYEHAEFERLHAALEQPFADILAFAYATGWRKEEILGLRWEWVDRRRALLTLPDSKTGEGRTLPLVPALAEIIERRWRDRVDGMRIPEWVFHRRGYRIWPWALQRAWTAAREAVGLQGRTFHAWRRTAARDLIEAGADYKSAMTVTGHRTMGVFLRYQIVRPEQTAHALDQMHAHRQGQGAGQKPRKSLMFRRSSLQKPG